FWNDDSSRTCKNCGRKVEKRSRKGRCRRYSRASVSDGVSTLAFYRNALQFQPVKIDLHTHILPRDWPDLDKKYGYGGFVRLDNYKPCCARMMVGDRLFREISDNVWEPTRRIEEMEG